jgi:hypothetical protein
VIAVQFFEAVTQSAALVVAAGKVGTDTLVIVVAGAIDILVVFMQAARRLGVGAEPPHATVAVGATAAAGSRP